MKTRKPENKDGFFSRKKKIIHRVTVLLITESFWILTLGRTLTRSSISIYSSRLCQSFHQVITTTNSDIFYLQTVMFSITDTDINIFLKDSDIFNTFQMESMFMCCTDRSMSLIWFSSILCN